MKAVAQHHEPDSSSAATQREARAGAGDLSARLAGSPRQRAERQLIGRTLGHDVQRMAGEREGQEGAASQWCSGPAQRQGNRAGLPDDLKTGIESLSGMDMSDVRVHLNSSQPAQLNALAVARGNEIHLGPGQEQHLPHEAWHVVQQRQGRVQPTLQRAGVAVNDDGELEKEADLMGERAMQLKGRNPQALISNPGRETAAVGATTQCKYIASAGFELEWKGVGAMKKYNEHDQGQNEDFGKHEVIKTYAGGNYKLEIDARSPEIVSRPATTKVDLLGYLDASIVTLNEIWDLVREGGDLTSHGFPATTYAWESELGGTAKPQLTLGIKKEGLKDFATDAVKEQAIDYEHVKAGKNDGNFVDIHAPRIDAEVRKKFKTRWQDKLAGICPGASSKMATSSPEAVGLVLMSVLSTMFASRAQNKDDENAYYKARFSILPRIALSGLYDQMEEAKRIEVKALLELIKDSWANSGLVDTLTTHAKDESVVVAVKDELQSIYDPSKRKEKTMKNYGNAKKQVDLISSDHVASSSDVGEAVGAYSPELQENLRGLSGLFELRSMPYVDIGNKDSVKKVVSKTIESYGDMD